MSVSNVSTAISTIDDGRALLSSTFLEFCAKVRNNDPSILPEVGYPFRIRKLSEGEGMELADALLENNSVTYLELETANYTKSSAEAMAKYVRTSKCLRHIRWSMNELTFPQRDEVLCCFMLAIQESTSLKELDNMTLPLKGGLSNLALENMLTQTQSLRSLYLICPSGPLEDIAAAAASSVLKKNTTLRELTLIFLQGMTLSPLLTSLRDHPLLRRLCLHGDVRDLTGLDTVLLSNTSKITELDIHSFYEGRPMMLGLTPILQALARRPTLTKLGLRRCPLGRGEARLLQMALCNIPSLQTLDLASSRLESAGLAELAPALYHNTSIEVLDMSDNYLNDMESAELLRDILRSNKTITTLGLSENYFGETTGAVECIADGLGSNSTLLKIDLSLCALGDGGVSTLAQIFGSRNTTLQKLTLKNSSITSFGVRVLLETMEQNNLHITDLDLQRNPIGNEGASLLVRSLGNNAVPNLTSLSLFRCGIRNVGFTALVSALKQNTSLLHLDLRYGNGVSERAFLALAESLPEIKVLQRIVLSWGEGLALAMPFVLAGLRKNTSLFHFHVTGCTPDSVPPTTQDTSRCSGGWMQEMECLGYRNRFLTFICAPEETHRPGGIWAHALARVAKLPDVIFEVLRSKPSLVPSKDTGGKEAAEDTGVLKTRKCDDG
jgi:Ran GTPase-activating protein (RanGAP) involved in mRNA processing and transport